LRRDFGHRYLKLQAGMVFLLIPFFSLLFPGDDLRPLFWFQGAYLLMLLLARLNVAARSKQPGNPGHSRHSGVRIQGFTCAQRARIYLVSFLTGLRRNELASLTRRSFALDAAVPTITVEATYSKHRRKDVLSLHPELVTVLRPWLKGLEPGEKLFPMLARRKTWRMVKKDLERVVIPYETEDGIADFHAAGRHTHITELLRNGATLAEAKELARHSDIKTTMKYTHIGLKDQARAVANLQAPNTPRAARSQDAGLHGRCISGGSGGQSPSSSGNDPTVTKRENPCEGKGFGVVCHRVALDDLVGAT
jgi:hypothetical protein